MNLLVLESKEEEALSSEVVLNFCDFGFSCDVGGSPSRSLSKTCNAALLSHSHLSLWYKDPRYKGDFSDTPRRKGTNDYVQEEES